MPGTAVLAYSGGLDTSCMIAWLKEDYGYDEVVAILVGTARIVTPNSAHALRTAPGAHHYRIERVEITTAPGVKQLTALVGFGDNSSAQTRASQVPHHLILSAAYVHGSPTVDIRRCVELNSATSAVVDSYIVECHARGEDSQAVWGANGPGPFLIQNNQLEGAGENVMFGGGDPQASELVQEMQRLKSQDAEVFDIEAIVARGPRRPREATPPTPPPPPLSSC